MTLPTLTLAATGLDPLTLDPSDGWIVQKEFDTGDAIVRASTENAPGSDGAVDTTQLVGPRVVTVPVVISAPSIYDLEDMERRLRAFTNARLRPTLTLTRPGGTAKQMTVRHLTWTQESLSADATFVLWQAECPSGILESVELHEAEVAASAESEDGRVYDLDPDRVYPESEPVGQVEVVNAGDRTAWPLIVLHGPWSGEASVVNVSTGQALVFDGESVSDGDWLEIDTRARTVRLNGDPANSRYNRLVFPDSDWWGLEPGVNVLRFLPEVFTAPARMTVAWRDAYS